jgi:hypothetical protein
MWTIHDIEVIFHHYYSTAPWPRGRTNPYEDSVHKLWVHGMLTDKSNPHVTPKGCTFIDMLRNTPAPVAGFYDPRIKEDAA